ncbi:MAG: hypothetical protein A3F74_26350 [Betaproteobacteria bacterium RIFCSPLOWO2_12_FULL_62_58]|nr:MAG: hypothetical protein A3F74_26350 [Betaproteobacteria bacterium RIFCSPLOWO2_12_FULL_62_58]
MTDHLNITLALTKQAYEKLTRLVSLAELERFNFGSGPKRERIAELLKKLNTNINSIQRTLSEHVTDSSEAPILSVPPAHRTFYNEVVLPHGKSLQRAYFEISGLGMLMDLLDDPTAERPKPLMLNAISWGLERWNGMLDEDESFEWYERGFNIEGAQDLVGMPWFQPDEWAQNLKLLQPVLVDRSPQVMRDHVRYRLTEIYRAFSYGLWMAAVALSRSLVEFSLKANATRLGISITYTGAGGRPEDKSLKQLGKEVANVLPALAPSIETVRETGNRILHPKKHDVIAHPKVMRAEALDCIRAARLIVENVYSEVFPAK